MCGRYYLERELGPEELRQVIDAVNRRVNAGPVKTEGEVFPADTVPVIANSRALVPTPFAMTWGYTLPDGRRLINARSETARDKPLLRDGITRRRCVVPASWYFEWQRQGREKTKYAIRPADGGPTYLAGIYRLENGRPAFAVLTRAPADAISFIHDRMPVLLPRELLEAWLDPANPADALLRAAVTDVAYEKADPSAPEQLGMEL